MEPNLLMSRTFLILGGMLIITTITARLNKAYETSTELFITVGGSFLFLFSVMIFADSYPINLIVVAIFSGFIGWSLGPTIAYIGESFKFRKYLKSKMVLSKSIKREQSPTFWEKFMGANEEKKTGYYYKSEPSKIFDRNSNEFKELKDDFDKNVLHHDRYNQEWQNVVFQAMVGTTLAVIIAGTIVAFIPTDFSFLGIFLWIALLALIVVEILNAFVFKSERRRILYSYCGVVIFSLYLIYDFNYLEKAIAAGDNSWGTAVKIAVNLYLDIINLFIDLLEILASSD
ncbi:MAG: Bax inhibitor-1 family protein [Flavobacteriaceae bacterium]|tara:strand:- start:4937 stop:5797 length:861 start_codon:yes stop_codon:yes gene_type:complete